MRPRLRRLIPARRRHSGQDSAWTKPGDVPVELPIKFEFILNLTTAKALGLAIPASFLSLADDLIE